MPLSPKGYIKLFMICCSLLGRKGKAWKGFYIASFSNVQSLAKDHCLFPRITRIDINTVLLFVKICAIRGLNYCAPGTACKGDISLSINKTLRARQYEDKTLYRNEPLNFFLSPLKFCFHFARNILLQFFQQ